MLSRLSTSQTHFTGGVLLDRCQRNAEGLFARIDTTALAQVYATTHDSWYAEPEFCGKWLDTAMQVYGTTGNGGILERAAELVRAIRAGQRPDGYLGTYHPGLEFESFSVWNQQFTIMGLLSYYETTGDCGALECACRCADYLAASYLAPGAPDLLDAINQGIENSCLLLQMARLARLTEEPRYAAFCEFIVQRWERSNLRLVSAALRYADPVFYLGCLKAAEVLICYQGLVALSRVAENEDYLTAATRYWEAVARRQIGIAGNGSVFEYWTLAGNRAAALPVDAHPNENCVAVCWMKLSAALLEATGEARFGDAFERTLYNHLLGAQARDGRDFSYYQALEGRKVHVTLPGAYSCCRYRGMNMLAHLPGWVALRSGPGLTLNLYASSRAHLEVDGVPVCVTQQTSYPREGQVEIALEPRRALRFPLSLRVPDWAGRVALTLDGEPVHRPVDGGYLHLTREWPARVSRLELSLDMPVQMVGSASAHGPVAALQRGPLVLALDSRYGDLRHARLGPEAPALRLLPANDDPLFPMVVLEDGGGHTFVDYASAGSADPVRDHFRVWLPLEG